MSQKAWTIHLLLANIAIQLVAASPHSNDDELQDHGYLLLEPHHCFKNDDCPRGSVCLRNLCFWSRCLVEGRPSNSSEGLTGGGRSLIVNREPICTKWNGIIAVGGKHSENVNFVTQAIPFDNQCLENETLIPPHPFSKEFYGGISLVYNGSTVVCGGFSRDHGVTSQCKTLTTYGSHDMGWEHFPSMLKRRVFGAGVAIDDKIFVMGGSENLERLSPWIPTSSEIFDGKQWIEGPELEQGLIHHCMIKLNSSAILLAGGRNSERNSYILDWNSKEWIKQGSLINPRVKHACGRLPEKFGSKVFTIGGEDIPFGTIDVFDESTGTWSLYEAPDSILTTADFDYIKPIVDPSIVEFQNELYLIGGSIDDNPMTHVFKWGSQDNFFTKTARKVLLPSTQMMCSPFKGSIPFQPSIPLITTTTPNLNFYQDLAILPKSDWYAVASSSFNHLTNEENGKFAIDGFMNEWNHVNVTKTKRESAPWLLIDMKMVYNVSIVRVFGRKDCCHRALEHSEIRIGNQDPRESRNFDSNELCGVIELKSLHDWQHEIVCKRPIEGRFLTLQKTGQRIHLQVNEVDVLVSMSECIRSDEKPVQDLDFTKKSEVECRNQCLNIDTCVGIVFGSLDLCALLNDEPERFAPAKGFTTILAKCLKGKRLTQTYEVDIDECPLLDKALDFRNLSSLSIPVDGIQDCHKVCNFYADCQYYNFDTKSNICSMSSSLGSNQLEQSPGMVSGSRNCTYNCQLWQGIVSIGGYNFGGVGTVTQVIRTKDPCHDLSDYIATDSLLQPHPYIQTYLGATSFVFNGSIVVCGGYSAEYGYVQDCYRLVENMDQQKPTSRWEKFPSLNQKRANAKGVSFGQGSNEQLWILGGQFGNEAERKIASSEVFQNGKWQEGPRAPKTSQYELGHCLVQLNDSATLLAGGETEPFSSYIYSWVTKTWTEIGNLNYAREYHGCARLPDKFGGKVIAVGGVSGPLEYIEVLDEINGIWEQLEIKNREVLDEDLVGKIISYPCLVELDEELYLLGGNIDQGKDVLPHLYKWSLEANFFVKSGIKGLSFPNFNMACAPHTYANKMLDL